MTMAYLLLEWSHAFAALHPAERIGAALFQSVSARTAGFNVVDMGAMLPATLVLTCVAMFIGAAPGSAGGGIKVTTLAALIAGLRAELRASSAQLLDRTLPDAVIRKAIGVAFLSLVIVAAAFFGLLLLETHAPLALLFEVVSAFSTTGLSVGVTPELSAPGKLLVTFVMFIGRIGPLTLALAFSVKAMHAQVERPSERVMIG
jgi:trk system potassium uptake protein TrkH